MDIKKYYDESVKKLNDLDDEEFLEILQEVGVDCELKSKNNKSKKRKGVDQFED
jgi:hypothetical protein